MFVDGKEFSADNPEAIKELERLFEQNRKKGKKQAGGGTSANSGAEQVSGPKSGKNCSKTQKHVPVGQITKAQNETRLNAERPLVLKTSIEIIQ